MRLPISTTNLLALAFLSTFWRRYIITKFACQKFVDDGTSQEQNRTKDSTSRHHTLRRTGISTQCGRQRGTRCVSSAVRARRQAQQLQRERVSNHGSARERSRHGASSALRAWCCPIRLPDHHQYEEVLATSPTRDPGTNPRVLGQERTDELRISTRAKHPNRSRQRRMKGKTTGTRRQRDKRR